MIDALISIFLHLDKNLPLITHEYGMWTYLILFFIIFFETGFIIFPFLPGDSLLFVGGAAAASGILDLQWLLLAIILGAVIGDTVNYWIANYLGLRVFLERFPTIVRQEHIDRTYGFYEKYGGATIFVARFVPLVRTFAPFLAGIGSMQYRRFLFYNILGAVGWAFSIILLGYFAGTQPIVKENMSLLLLGVLLLMGGTILLIAASIIKSFLLKKKAGSG
ncbi:VTT domain-containing protein [uncultured Methanoregula sp.]|uniref:VTT domain-containing protein n=1 Tax=uncultured Methanoregula sp. TaxID=1005933 RepID=UPI002AAAFB61|nr:VTT domain-containing protein [uncultured Methanoregula sp.]